MVDDPSLDPKAFDWKAQFSSVFEREGFDAVVGNPPYVRQELLSPIKAYLQGHYQTYHGMADLYVYFYERGVEILKPGGRLAFVVTNKWMKAGYGEPLRRYFGEKTWVEQVVDFGHAKQFFKDADVFPSFLIVRRPTGSACSRAARVCVVPRDLVRIDQLSSQIHTDALPVEQDQFGSQAWSFEAETVKRLLAKLRSRGRPLREFTGARPLVGVKTGFNEAFLIDGGKRQAIIANDPKSASVIKPYLRGQDIDRWVCDWGGLFMIALKSSNDFAWPWADLSGAAELRFAAEYPGIYSHLKPLETELNHRQDKGRFWWELRSCAYWEEFNKPRIIYQEIQFHPSYAFEDSGRLSNNKTFFLPVGDPYLIGVLNSPLLWWHNWRFLPHMKDEALTPVTFLMESLPVAEPSEKARSEIESVVRRLMDCRAEAISTRRHHERLA